MKVPLRSGAPADLSHIGRQRGQAQRWTMTLLFVLVLAVAAIGAATTFSQASSPSGLSQSHARAFPPPVPSLSPSFFFLPCTPFMPRVLTFSWTSVCLCVCVSVCIHTCCCKNAVIHTYMHAHILLYLTCICTHSSAASPRRRPPPSCPQVSMKSRRGRGAAREEAERSATR